MLPPGYFFVRRMATTVGQPIIGSGEAFGASRPPVDPIASAPGSNEYDSEGRRTRDAEARKIFEDHVKGLQARRERDLISEKLLLHIDGSGDFQWADIADGARVEIPRWVSEFRKTENLLRLIVDNAVSHHTTMPLRYFAEAGPDRRAREKAMVDMIWANHLAQTQDLNGVFAEALYMAMPMGFGTVHGYWRDDVAQDFYNSVYKGDAASMEDLLFQPQGPGMVDAFSGNPFDQVFDPGATRGSIRWSSYGRLLDGDLVRDLFGHIPEVRDLEGSRRIPSAAEYQRIAREWKSGGLGMHGSPVMTLGQQSSTDLITVICRETAPGVLPTHPRGRLEMIVVPGEVDTRRNQGKSSHAVKVVDQPLPGADFSFSLFYSHHRGSDIHGKPWVEDIDQLQVDLNIALSKRWEATNKLLDAPIIAPGGAIGDDMADLGGYNLLEVEPSLAGWRPQTMTWPTEIFTVINTQIEDLRRMIFTQGGYQASSRGEAPGSRMAYRAILALQQADNTVHGPVNKRFRRSATDFMRRCWSQMKAYGDVPWLVDIVGDEYAHLIDPYIDATRLSERPPQYKLVNAFGSSPEVRAQEVLELMQTRGADGQPFLRTEEARRQYPNQMIFDSEGDPVQVQRRRAKTIARKFESEATDYREEHQFYEMDPTDPNVQKAAQVLFFRMESLFPRLRDDNLEAHLNAYSELVQDETADPIARLALMQRQNLYFEWQAMMAQAAMQAQMAAPQQGGGGGQPAQREQAGGEQGAMVSATAR